MLRRSIRCIKARRILLALIAVYSLLFIALAFDLTPMNPEPGQKITISGTAKPGEALKFESSFRMNLPVKDNGYEYETTVQIPQKPNRLTVTAKNVQDFNAGVKMIIWITKSFQVKDGTIRLSQADVPPGSYSLKMFGNAIPGSSEVTVDINADTQINADSDGKYSLVIDTSGIPEGEYHIRGTGETKTIRIGDGGSSFISDSKKSTSDSGNTVSTEDFSKKEHENTGIGINRDTVQWYAKLTGFQIKNSSQYDQAEKILKKRLDGGYWKIIAQGEPLTEEAGDCQQEYCLVRGADACTVCREKDIILHASSATSNLSSTKVDSHVASSKPNNPQSRSISIEENNDSLMSRIGNWLGGWMSMLYGLL